jgi:arginyl-tRNA synthetase
VKDPLIELIAQAVAAQNLPLETSALREAIVLERTRDPAHGDFATNVAMRLAKAAGKKPRELAEAIVKALPVSDVIEKTEIAGPGFINFHLSPRAYARELDSILESTETYGRRAPGSAGKVMVEFVSANPTGPLHVGHGRQAALGDAISALLQSQGYDVAREYYYNDAGAQINNLALSVQARAHGLTPADAAWPKDGYQGDYIAEIAQDYLAKKTVRNQAGQETRAAGDKDNLDAIREFAVAYLRNEQDLDLQTFGVKFDVYYLESSLYTEGKVEATVRGFLESGKAYEQDGALWLRTTDYGDDKDRVVRKSDGTYTYFVPDVAYHVTKWERGFHRAINVQGTDHHGTVARVRAGLQALGLGIPQGYPSYVLHNMVKVMRGGEEVKISKRAGSYVTVRDLIDWVGRDAVRFFLAMRQPNSEFTFDVDLARSRSEENPVYYVQYAHARVCSVLRQAKEKGITHSRESGAQNIHRLTEAHERALMQRVTQYPEALATAATSLEPHQLAHYLNQLAGDFHTYYNAHTFLVDDEALRNARLNLIIAARQVIANGLDVLGVSAPETM